MSNVNKTKNDKKRFKRIVCYGKVATAEQANYTERECLNKKEDNNYGDEFNV